MLSWIWGIAPNCSSSKRERLRKRARLGLSLAGLPDGQEPTARTAFREVIGLGIPASSPTPDLFIHSPSASSAGCIN